MKRSIFAILAVLVVLASGAALAKNAAKNGLGVTIQSCVVNQNAAGATNGINIVYFNTRSIAAKEVDFTVNYRGAQYVLVDTGTFSQGATINHNLTNALVGMGWAGPAPDVCTVRRVVLANGRVFGP